jgi:uncharacterized protein
MEDDTEPRPESLLPYEDWIEAATRQVVAQAIAHVAENGLPGEHHFYLTFRTDHPGVVVPPRLRAQYPQEMTIVLQHQFWDLEITEEGFAVTLSFHKQLERLSVPFAAVRSFADPSVNFALEFASPEIGADAEKAVVKAGPPMPIEAQPPTPEERTTAEVVTLDSFRKR